MSAGQAINVMGGVIVHRNSSGTLGHDRLVRR